MTPRLTIGITTRNRARSLNACLRSLDLLAPLAPEILVFDDGSMPAAGDQIDPDVRVTRILRDDGAPGCIAGRNRLMSEARAPVVLLLDDDTRILSRESIEWGIEVLDADRQVAAVAFAQAEADGRPWPLAMQPSTAQVPSVIASFIGFAHLLRRDVFLAVGGYREELIHLGEEKDLCLRLLDRGYRTVYLPDARVSHVPDPGGRDRARYLRLTVRSDCLSALHNDPFPRVCWTVPVHYARYFRLRRGIDAADPWGWLWVAREIVPRAAAIVRSRTPVSHATIAAWQSLKVAPRPYQTGALRKARSHAS